MACGLICVDTEMSLPAARAPSAKATHSTHPLPQVDLHRPGSRLCSMPAPADKLTYAPPQASAHGRLRRGRPRDGGSVVTFFYFLV